MTRLVRRRRWIMQNGVNGYGYVNLCSFLVSLIRLKFVYTQDGVFKCGAPRADIGDVAMWCGKIVNDMKQKQKKKKCM